jgi:hypothetical protein
LNFSRYCSYDPVAFAKPHSGEGIAHYRWMRSFSKSIPSDRARFGKGNPAGLGRGLFVCRSPNRHPDLLLEPFINRLP